jgi:hypothetical protein
MIQNSQANEDKLSGQEREKIAAVPSGLNTLPHSR